MTDLFVNILLFVAGIIIIIKCGDIFIDGSRWISDVTGISKVVIGATVISVATTAPEYFVSLIANLKGSYEMSIGNAVGSLICNIAIALAFFYIFKPGRQNDKQFAIKGSLMILSTVSLWVFLFNGSLSIFDAIVLLLIFAVFMFINIKYAKGDKEDRVKRPTNKNEITVNVLKLILGATGIILSSNIIVDSSQVIARFAGIPESIIGLTMIAIGTSLPEIITAITAFKKGESELSVGNILGANVIDSTLILVTGTFVTNGALEIGQQTMLVDLPVAIMLMIVAIVPTIITKRFARWQGITLVTMYVAYLGFLFI